MNYRLDKYGNKLSALGFGCMRFQQKLGHIDMEKAERQILLALKTVSIILIPPTSTPAARLPSVRSLKKTRSATGFTLPPSCPITS